MIFPGLLNIKISNGFNTDLGDRVLFGPPPEGSEYGTAGLYYYPISKSIEPSNLRWTHQKLYEIRAISYTDEPETDLELIEQDIVEALSGQVNGEPRVQIVPEDTFSYGITTQGKKIIELSLRVHLVYRTNAFTSRV